jgi:hypothetical protein
MSIIFQLDSFNCKVCKNSIEKFLEINFLGGSPAENGETALDAMIMDG